MLGCLIGAGAHLNGDNPDELRFFRRCLLKLDWPGAYDLITRVHETGVASNEMLARILARPDLRQHLAKRLQALDRMIPELRAERRGHANVHRVSSGTRR